MELHNEQCINNADEQTYDTVLNGAETLYSLFIEFQEPTDIAELVDRTQRNPVFTLQASTVTST